MIELLTPEEQGQVLFVLALLQGQFGGAPALARGEDGTYVVVPTCSCSKCLEFRKTYDLKPNNTILGAAKAYGDDKLCHQDTLDARHERRRVH